MAARLGRSPGSITGDPERHALLRTPPDDQGGVLGFAGASSANEQAVRRENRRPEYQGLFPVALNTCARPVYSGGYAIENICP